MSTKRIEKLTKAQAKRIPEFREKWLKLGLSTEPADRPAMEAAVDEAYRAAGLEPPRLRVWLHSPLEGAVGATILTKGWPAQVRDQVRDQVGDQVWAQVGAQVRDQVGAQVRAQVWAQVGAQVGAQVWDQVGDQVGDQVWAQVGAQVRAQVGAQVWAQVWDQVGAQVRAQVRDQVRAQVGDQVWAQVRDQVGAQVGAQVRDQVGAQVRAQVRAQVFRSAWGQHDAGWLAFYDFFRHATGLQSAERLGGLTGAAAAGGWWWPFRGAVVLTDRPCRLARDAEGRLHCANRAALEYRDGWGVYAWHGLRVPSEWILHPEKLEPSVALSWPNVEQRRAAAEILGWERILSALSARSVDKDADPQIGELLEVDLPDAPKQKFLRVRCGTGRAFCLPVPPHVTTALQGNAWTFGFEDAGDVERFRDYECRT